MSTVIILGAFNLLIYHIHRYHQIIQNSVDTNQCFCQLEFPNKNFKWNGKKESEKLRTCSKDIEKREIILPEMHL